MKLVRYTRRFGVAAAVASAIWTGCNTFVESGTGAATPAPSTSTAVSSKVVATSGEVALPAPSLTESLTPSSTASTLASASTPPSAASVAVAVPELPKFNPEQWQKLTGDWRFEPSGELTCGCKTNASAIVFKGAKPKNFEASVQVMFLTNESSLGMIFRLQGDDFGSATFYQYEWYTAGTHHDRRLSLMTKKAGWHQIVTPVEPLAKYGIWYEFKVRAEDDHIQTYLDGVLTFDKHDKSLLQDGKIGLHVFQPRPVRLRGFRLSNIGGA